jgi:hypothetical protein
MSPSQGCLVTVAPKIFEREKTAVNKAMDIENIHPANAGVDAEVKGSTKGFETLLQEVRTLSLGFTIISKAFTVTERVLESRVYSLFRRSDEIAGESFVCNDLAYEIHVSSNRQHSNPLRMESIE